MPLSIILLKGDHEPLGLASFAYVISLCHYAFMQTLVSKEFDSKEQDGVGYLIYNLTYKTKLE